MDVLVWNAARRLAAIVSLAVAIIGVPLASDVLTHRGSLCAEVCGAAAGILLGVALAALRQARRFFLDAEPLRAPAHYRDNARPRPDCLLELKRSRATHLAARALMALAAAGSLALVAASSR